MDGGRAGGRGQVDGALAREEEEGGEHSGRREGKQAGGEVCHAPFCGSIDERTRTDGRMEERLPRFVRVVLGRWRGWSWAQIAGDRTADPDESTERKTHSARIQF